MSPAARAHHRAACAGGGAACAGPAVCWPPVTGVGSTGLQSIWRALDDPTARQIVLDIRLPRTLGAWLAGALLGLAGAVAQGLFRNPLADPFLLGSASGASLGVALALVLFGVSPLAASWLSALGLTGAAFIGSMAAVLLTLALARGVQHTLRLLLAGVIVGVVLGAIGSLVTLLVPETMPAMQAFMLGSTGFVGWPACGLMAAAFTVCLAVAWTLSPVLDGLTLGEATARSLGLPLAPLRLALVGGAGAGHRRGRGADRVDRLCRAGGAAPGALGGQDDTRAADASVRADGWGTCCWRPTCWRAPGLRRRSCPWVCSPPCWAAATCCG